MSKPFMSYRTYSGPRATRHDWTRAFNARMGIAAAKKAVGKESPRDILGVPMTATWTEIRTAYYKLAMKYHPDSGGRTADAAKFRRACAAYELLEDEFGK